MLLNNLSLDSLRTLVATQDLGGFGRASERLPRTPSAISLQMKRLQEEIGVPLFRKQGRKMLLAEQGETALRYARRVLEVNDEMIDTLRGSSLAGVVRIGFGQDFTRPYAKVWSLAKHDGSHETEYANDCDKYS